jgi:hypothetical protein
VRRIENLGILATDFQHGITSVVSTCRLSFVNTYPSSPSENLVTALTEKAIKKPEGISLRSTHPLSMIAYRSRLHEQAANYSTTSFSLHQRLTRDSLAQPPIHLSSSRPPPSPHSGFAVREARGQTYSPFSGSKWQIGGSRDFVPDGVEAATQSATETRSPSRRCSAHKSFSSSFPQRNS